MTTWADVGFLAVAIGVPFLLLAWVAYLVHRQNWVKEVDDAEDSD